MMNKHSLKDWLVAVRPWSFPASAMPVAVTLAFLYWMQQDVNWTNGVWALLNIIVFHAAGNTWSDYFDYKHRVDREDTHGVRTLTGGLFRPQEIFRLSLSLLVVALVAGIGLLVRTGLPLLYIGIGGAACTLLYPALKYRALGDVVIFVAYALLPMLGTAYVATGVMDWTTMWAGVPVGLITVAILHANNTRDITTDVRADIRTLAMTVGGLSPFSSSGRSDAPGCPGTNGSPPSPPQAAIDSRATDNSGIHNNFFIGHPFYIQHHTIVPPQRRHADRGSGYGRRPLPR